MLIFQLYGWRSSSGSSSSARSFAQTVDQENEANVAAASARQGVEALRSAQESASIENDHLEAASRRRQRVRVRVNRTRKHVRKAKDSSAHEEPEQQQEQQEQASPVAVSEPVLQPAAQTPVQATTASVRVTIAIADALRTQITFTLPTATATATKTRAAPPKRPSARLLARTSAAKPLKKSSVPANKSLKPLPAAPLYPAWFSTAFSKRGSEIKPALRNATQGSNSVQPSIQHLLHTYRTRTPRLTIVA